jgi:flagellar operon protein
MLINPVIPAKTGTGTPRPTSKTGFKGMFAQALAAQAGTPLKISKHAQARIAERDIEIKPEQWRAIYEKLNEAKAMGIREPLVLTKDKAIVVSAKNDTVITVMNRSEAKTHIFSNIDGAILLDD